MFDSNRKDNLTDLTEIAQDSGRDSEGVRGTVETDDGDIITLGN